MDGQIVSYLQRSSNTNQAKQVGVGLIELMISIALGLLIMAGVLQMFVTSNANSISSQSVSRIQENLRYALTRIEDDVAQSGNLGCYSSSVASRLAADNTGIEYVRNMLANPLGVRDFSSFASGRSNITPAESAADPDNVLAGTDTLVLKYANSGAAIPILSKTATTLTLDTSHFAYNQLQQNQIAIAGDCESAAIFVITNDLDTDSDGVNDNATIQMATTATANTTSEHQIGLASSLGYLYGGTTGSYEYFIRQSAGATGPCTSAGVGRQNCALFRRVGSGAAEELVQGVHSMQVDYGIEVELPSGASSLIYTRNPTSPQLASVDRVRVRFTFNAADATLADGTGVLTKPVERIFAVRNRI